MALSSAQLLDALSHTEDEDDWTVMHQKVIPNPEIECNFSLSLRNFWDYESSLQSLQANKLKKCPNITNIPIHILQSELRSELWKSRTPKSKCPYSLPRTKIANPTCTMHIRFLNKHAIMHLFFTRNVHKTYFPNTEDWLLGKSGHNQKHQNFIHG